MGGCNLVQACWGFTQHFKSLYCAYFAQCKVTRYSGTDGLGSGKWMLEYVDDDRTPWECCRDVYNDIKRELEKHGIVEGQCFEE